MGLVSIICLLLGFLLLFMAFSLVLGSLTVMCGPPSGWLLFAMLLGVAGVTFVNFALTGQWWFTQPITLWPPSLPSFESWNTSLPRI